MAASPSPRIVLACVTWRNGELAVLTPTATRGVTLPQATLAANASPDDAADALVKRTLGRAAAWRSQVGALREDGALSILYVAVLPADTAAAPQHEWRALPRGAPGGALRAALAHLRERIDREPVAFRLLGATFTLSDLQLVYELLLERRLHKASFRRSLMAAHLVEPTEHWRSEGRGRPAQLFRYAPRRRRGLQRAVRFDLLG
jgi:8-oxo-dGTP diphosphatase